MDETAGISTPAETSSGAASTAPAISPDSGSAMTAAPVATPVSSADFFVAHFNQPQAGEPEAQTPSVGPAPEAASIAPDAPTDANASAGAGGLEIPETDDDLSQLTDQTAISHIRGLRQHVRGTLEPKAKAYDGLMEAAGQHGISQELFEPSFQLLNGLMATEARQTYDEQGRLTTEEVATTYPFWDRLSQMSQTHLSQLLIDATQFFPDYVSQRLPREAHLAALEIDPAEYADFQRFQSDQASGVVPSGAYDADIVTALPEALRDTYRRASPDLQAELNLMAGPVRERFLRHEAELSDFKRQQAAQAEQQRQQQAAQQQAQAEQRVNEFSGQQEQSFMSDLAKTWSPFGPGDKQNERLHRFVFNEVREAMYADPKISQLIAGATAALRQGNQLALTGLMTQLNAHKTRLRNEAVGFFDSLLKATHTRDQAQRDQNAQLKSVTNTGGFPDERGNGLPNQTDWGDPNNVRAIATSLGIRLNQ